MGAPLNEISAQPKSSTKKIITLGLFSCALTMLQKANNPIKNNWNEIDSLEGEITWLNLNGGNGRLKCDEHSNLFFYLNESENSEVLNVGDRVKFSIGKNDKGPKAEKLVKIDTI